MTVETIQENVTKAQDYMKQYTELVVEAANVAVAQGTAAREGFGAIAAEGLKQAEALGAKEQELVMSSLETMTAQARDSYARLNSIFAVK